MADEPHPTDIEPPSDSQDPRGKDEATALALVDPEDRALDELADYLSSAGVELMDMATVEATLEVAVGGPEGEGERPARRATRSASHRGQAAAEHAATFEAVGDSLGDGGLEVVFSDDHLTAVVRGIDEKVTVREFARTLKHHSVRNGIRVADIKAAVARARRGEPVDEVLAAQGEPAHPGRDAAFAWEADVGGRAGTILEDGTIDLRDRRLVTVVKAGQLLGRCVPAEDGVKGRDVLGRALVPPKPTQLTVVPGTNVRGEEEADGVTAYYADAEGGISHDESVKRDRRSLRISIVNVMRIEQDVGYSTGHIRFDGDVVIDGSVTARFQVRATGSVTIGGNVEAGARIEAGGDILVSGGVVGDTTELDAGRSVMAKFLQSCKVQTEGDVQVGAYVFEAEIRSRGTLTVAGMGEGSGRALVGGLVWAAKGIETPSLGSPSNPRIRLVLGIDPNLLDETVKLRGRLRAAQEQRAGLLEVLGIERLQPARIKQALRRTKDKQERARKVQVVHKLTRLTEALRHGRERLEQIASAQRELAGQATLAVTGTAFPGPELRVGEFGLTIAEEVRSVHYRLVAEDGQTAVKQQAA